MTKDEMIKESKRITTALEELVEEIEAEKDGIFTDFDIRRTTIDLKTSAYLVAKVTEKLGEVGKWTKR